MATQFKDRTSRWKPFWSSDPAVTKIDDECYLDVFENRDPETLTYGELKECLGGAVSSHHREAHPPRFGDTGNRHKAEVYESLAEAIKDRLREFRRVDREKIRKMKNRECQACCEAGERGLVVSCPGITTDPKTNERTIGGKCRHPGTSLQVMSCLLAKRDDSQNPCALCSDCYIAYKPHLFPEDRRCE